MRNRTYLYIFTHLFLLVENFIVPMEASSLQFTIDYVLQNSISKIFVDFIIIFKKKMQTTMKTRMKPFKTKKPEKKINNNNNKLYIYIYIYMKRGKN